MGSNLTQGSSFVFEKRVALSFVGLQCSKISTFALRMHAEIDNEEGGASHVWNVHACGFCIASKPRAVGRMWPIGKALLCLSSILVLYP